MANNDDRYTSSKEKWGNTVSPWLSTFFLLFVPSSCLIFGHSSSFYSIWNASLGDYKCLSLSNPAEQLGFIRSFNIMYRWLDVNPTIEILFSFHGTKIRAKESWVTMCIIFRGRDMALNNWKIIFVKVRGRDGSSMVTNEEDHTLYFPLS